MARKGIVFRIITYAAAFLLAVPLLVILVWSFANNWPWPLVFPKEFGLRGWEYFFSPTSNSLGILLYSILLSLTVTLITLLVTIPAARALALYEFKGKKLVEILILAPLIVSPVAVAMGIHQLFIKLRLANTFFGVVLVHLIPCIPYSVRILKNVFESVGDKFQMQGKVLGASPIQNFIYVTLPIISPGILSAASLVFTVSFSQYFLTFLIGGGRIITYPMVMFPFIQSGDRMLASVYSIVFILASLICLRSMDRLLKKYYKRGDYFYL